MSATTASIYKQYKVSTRPATGGWAERRMGGGVQARAPGLGPWVHDIITFYDFLREFV